MDPVTINRLLEVNRQFYQSFASPFAQTRRRLQPGVRRILEQLSPQAHILDLGCGSGELWRSLVNSDFRGVYMGLDFSHELLQLAMVYEDRSTPSEDSTAIIYGVSVEPTKSNAFPASKAQANFIQADLASPTWDKPLESAGFDVILAFAVLHHLPGVHLRLQVLRKVHRLLAPEGRFFHSVWQFLYSPRLRSRIQPWESIALSQDQVDPDDYLMDWRHGGAGLRYVHHFGKEELASLAQESRFKIVETFHSDGEGGKLGLYQVWEPKSE